MTNNEAVTLPFLFPVGTSHLYLGMRRTREQSEGVMRTIVTKKTINCRTSPDNALWQGLVPDTIGRQNQEICLVNIPCSILGSRASTIFLMWFSVLS